MYPIASNMHRQPRSSRSTLVSIGVRYVHRVGSIAVMTLLLAFTPFESSSVESVSTDVSVTGTVRDGNGDPIGRVAVTIYDDSSGDVLASTVLTNDLGQYSTDVSVQTSVGGIDVPTEFWIDSVYPNPVSAGGETVTVRYTTPGNRKVSPELEVFDLLGRRLKLPANLAAGMYFYRMWFSSSRSLLVLDRKVEIQLVQLRRRTVPPASG